MDARHKIIAAVSEAHDQKLITESTADTFVSFCEMADLEDEDDVDTLNGIIDYLEGAEDNPETDDDGGDGDDGSEEQAMTESELKLLIFESERQGDISSEQREILLGLMESAG